MIGCPALLEDLSVSAGLLLRPVQPRRSGGLVLPSDVDEFNLHLAGYDPDEEVSVEELEAQGRGS